MAVAETDGLIKMLTCAECDVDDDQHQADAPDDAESITGCRTNKRSRLVETGDDTLSERRRVTFDLPPEPDDAEDVERVQVQAPPNAAPCVCAHAPVGVRPQYFYTDCGPPPQFVPNREKTLHSRKAVTL
jgi:hypothetical protein